MFTVVFLNHNTKFSFNALPTTTCFRRKQCGPKRADLNKKLQLMSTVAKREEMEIVTAVKWKPLLKSAISAGISFKFLISMTYVEPMKVIRVSRIRYTFIFI